ncbi:MAG TPA: MtnX-like HAD-IB family phosphatase [Clostridiaceae bacterium]
MKKFAFISDFDGTLSDKDFYEIITENYAIKDNDSKYAAWRRKEINVVDYLGHIFKNIDREEAEIDQDIMKISLDPYTKEFIQNIESYGIDFYIVSAGTSYYINRVFEREGIKGVKVYSNEGIYKDKGIHFQLDKESEFYSDISGIDKLKVVESIKKNYDFIFYAGDSEPDVKAALIADVVFAKSRLIKLMGDNNKACIPFSSFEEVWKEVESYIKE